MSRGVHQLLEKHGFFAVRAGAAAAEPAGEAVAVLASLFGDEALPAVGTFVDRVIACWVCGWELR
jgi:hypothetical protein